MVKYLENITTNNEVDPNKVDEYIERWGKLDFLDGILDEELKITTTLSYEGAAIDILSIGRSERTPEERKFDDAMSMVIMPIIRRIIRCMKKPRVVTYKEVIDFMRELTIGDIIDIEVRNIRELYIERKTRGWEPVELGIWLYGWIRFLNGTIRLLWMYTYNKPIRYEENLVYHNWAHVRLEEVSEELRKKTAYEFFFNFANDKIIAPGITMPGTQKQLKMPNDEGVITNNEIAHLITGGVFDTEVMVCDCVCDGFVLKENGEKYNCGINYGEPTMLTELIQGYANPNKWHTTN